MTITHGKMTHGVISTGVNHHKQNEEDIMEKVICIVKYIIATASVALLLWAMFSFFEVISKNTTPNPTYNKANLFYMMVNENE